MVMTIEDIEALAKAWDARRPNVRVVITRFPPAVGVNLIRETQNEENIFVKLLPFDFETAADVEAELERNAALIS